jgi:Secretion system C-terminal sorting domain
VIKKATNVIRTKFLVLICAVFAVSTAPLFSQDSTNCFLRDFQPKSAEIPPYVDSTAPTAAPTATVIVNAADTLGKVSPYLLGNAVAVWVGQDLDNTVMINWVKMLAPNLIRFPGGSWSDVYFWNGDPGDLPNSIPSGTSYNYTTGAYTEASLSPAFGANQALTPAGYYDLRNKTGAQGLITVNYAYARYGTSLHPVQQAAHLAANWVRYDAGRTKFWEVGNEVSGPWEAGWLIDTALNKDGQPAIISGTLYGQHFKVFRDSMRAAAAEKGDTVYVGAIIDQYNDDNSSNIGNKGWNKQLFNTVGDSVDFYVWHDYYAGGNTSVGGQVYNGRIQVNADMTSMASDIATKGGAKRPLTLTEWNTGGPSSAETSIANGMQAVTVFCEMAKRNVGMSCRWLLSNWDTDGMFYYISPYNPAIPLWNPRPDFYYLYYLRQFLGDRMVGSSITGSSNILAYASTFSSGNTAVVVLNIGSTKQVVKVEPSNIGVGNRFYVYTLTGGSTAALPQSVVVNGDSGIGTVWGPNTDLPNIAAVAYPIGNSIAFNAPPFSVEYVLLDAGKNILSAVERKNATPPVTFELSQNYPNPFNPTTKIEYSVPQDGFISLKVYNVLGQEVATLFSGMQRPGNYTALFDASRLASGVYFYRLQAGNIQVTKKLVVMK